MDLTHQTIENYFEQYGWTCELQGDHGLATTFEGNNGNFLLTVHITEHWVCFTVATFILAPEPVHLSQLMTRLLQLNYTIQMVKFAFDDAGNVVISAELPSGALTCDLFEVVMDVLSHVADTYLAELLPLAITIPESSQEEDLAHE